MNKIQLESTKIANWTQIGAPIKEAKKSILRDAFFIYWTAYERLPQSKHFLILSL